MTHFLDFECCWIWFGAVTRDGYAKGINGLGEARQEYQRRYGEIEIIYVVHHICLNKLCTNPRHLIAIRRINHPDDVTVINRNKQFCVHNHEFTEENTIWRTRINRNLTVYKERVCKKCRGLNNERHHPKKSC